MFDKLRQKLPPFLSALDSDGANALTPSPSPASGRGEQSANLR
jgi:hypothetical protein